MLLEVCGQLLGNWGPLLGGVTRPDSPITYLPITSVIRIDAITVACETLHKLSVSVVSALSSVIVGFVSLSASKSLGTQIPAQDLHAVRSELR